MQEVIMNTEKKKYTFGFLVKRFFFLVMLGLIVGIACGILTGVCANLVMKHLKHMRF